jgi:ATP-dependent Lon protease
LTGKITKIGGLIYKLTGAKKAGVKKVLVSEENKDDVEKIKEENPKLIDDNFEVQLVANLYDVLSYTLEDFDKDDFEGAS